MILEPDVLARLHSVIRQEGCGLVACGLIGPSFATDVRPHEQAFEPWQGPVTPERVMPGSPAWERYRLHNAANLLHVQRGLDLPPGTSLRYHLAWAGGCVLYDTARLRDVGGFWFWTQLPPEHCGEDALVQLRLLARYGGCGIMPSGAYHQELPTTIPHRDVDAPKVLTIAGPRTPPAPAGPSRVTHRPAVAGAVRRVLVYTAAPGLGGAEISLGHLLAHASPAVDVIVAGTSPQVVTHLSGRRPGTPGVVLPASGPRAPAAQLAAFRRLRPQVVHVNRHVPWAAATAIAAALATPAARVVTVDQLPLRTVDLLELWRTRMLTLRADAAVAVGEASARRLEDFYALGRGSVRSIPNGVPDPGVRRRDRPAAAPLVVGAVGRLDPMKGHDVLLRALARVDGVRLTLVGRAPRRPPCAGWR